MLIEVEDFKSYKSNTLQGFFTVYIPEWGIGIPGFSLHQKESGERWVEFPSKPSTDPNKNGKYEKVVFGYDMRNARKFQREVLKVLDLYLRAQAEYEACPNTTDEYHQQ